MNIDKIWNASFSCELSDETTEALKELTKDVTVFTADKLHIVHKETGETADFVSVKKIDEAITKIKQRFMNSTETVYQNEVRRAVTKEFVELLEGVLNE